MMRFLQSITQKIVLLTLVLTSINTYSQGKIGFNEPYQIINPDSEFLFLEVKIFEESQSRKSKFLKLKLSTSEKSQQNLLIGFNDNEYLEFFIDLTKEDNVLKVPLSKGFNSDLKEVKLTLVKEEESDEYDIIQSTQIVYFKEKPITHIGFKEKEYTLKIAKDEDLEIPFELTSSKILKIQDSVKVFIKINGIDSINLSAKQVFERDFVGANLRSKLVIVLNKKEKENLIDFLTSRKSFSIEIDSITNESHTSNRIHISDLAKAKIIFIEHKLNKSTFSGNSYNFFAGTNFDLDDNIEANSFYSEIDVFLPDLSGNEEKAKLGIRAGLYKNNSVSRQEDREEENIVLEVLDDQPVSDQLSFERKRVRSTPNVSIENIGLFFEIFGTIKEKVTDDFIFRLLTGPHIEVIQRTEKTTFNNESLFSLGVESVSIVDLNNNIDLQNELAKSSSRTIKLYDSYFAWSMPTIYQSKNIEVFFNPFIGFGNPGIRAPINKSTLTSFGAFQFYLMERSFGIKLSGEVRRYFTSEQTPIISINISKSIDLKGLFKPKQ